MDHLMLLLWSELVLVGFWSFVSLYFTCSLALLPFAVELLSPDVASCSWTLQPTELLSQIRLFLSFSFSYKLPSLWYSIIAEEDKLRHLANC